MGCKTCGSTSTVCTACNSPYVLTPTGTCVIASQCPDGYEAKADKCVPVVCNTGCAVCITVGGYSCSRCSTGYFMQSDGTCVQSCPTGYIGIDAGNGGACKGMDCL